MTGPTRETNPSSSNLHNNLNNNFRNGKPRGGNSGNGESRRSNPAAKPPNFWFAFFLMVAMFATAALVMVETFQQAEAAPAVETPGAVYTHGVLQVTIPYQAAHAGAGRLVVEVLDPEDKVEGSLERRADVAEGKGRWQEEIRLENPPALDDLVWHRVHYRFDYNGGKDT
ncbi:MAG TPA: hypothetical protein VK129_12005, partial [Terriglobales bacterium]|nr:hypothetical protein [Terriglobales bacterium]